MDALTPIENSPIKSSPVPTPAVPLICPQCHEVVLPAYYYCPNCGKKLGEPGLSTSIWTQTWIYAFSIILPIMCFIAVSYWPGIKYLRSADPTAKQIGIVASILMAISTIITFWLGIVWLQQTIQSSLNSVNNLGGGF